MDTRKIAKGTVVSAGVAGAAAVITGMAAASSAGTVGAAAAMDSAWPASSAPAICNSCC
jgi:hypothetical protein